MNETKLQKPPPNHVCGKKGAQRISNLAERINASYDANPAEHRIRRVPIIDSIQGQFIS
jgi:hypothetical protein